MQVQLREGFVQVRDLRLHYLGWGEKGPPVVLHHATGFLAYLWQPIAQLLAHRYQVLAYDARGHGDSDKPETGYQWTELVEDLLAFIDAMGWTQAALVGHSSGGAAALAAAALRPQLVVRVVALEPVIFPPEIPQDSRSHEMAEIARKRRVVWPSRQELMEAYRQRAAFARWDEEVLRLYVEHGTFQRPDGQIELKMPGHLEALVYEGGVALDTWALLPQVRCPVLVVRGGEADSPLYKAAELVTSRLANARLVTVKEGSHFFPMEVPHQTAQLVWDFLAEEPLWAPS